MADPADREAHEVWIHYYPQREPLAQFFERNKPSQVHISKAHWISVDRIEEEEDEESGEEEGDEQNTELEECVEERLRRIAMLAEWNSLLKNPSAKKITQQTLKELAVKYKITVGKWLVFAPSSKIDKIWFTIAEAVVDGKLGFSAKVSTKNDEEAKHVICVYTEDFTDEEDVRRVEKALRRLNINDFLQYKADIYTLLNIYRDNNLGIRPCIYRSEAKVVPKATTNYDHSRSLASFLEEYKPSQISEHEATWINVSTKEHYIDTESQSKPEEDGKLSVAAMKKEWKAIQENKAAKKITPEILEELAVKYRITAGKWLIFADRAEIDGLWFSIAETTVAGRLGCSAKVSTKKTGDPKHVIWVYTKDFTDKDDVRRVEKVLRRLHVHDFMQYKADVYTILNIYCDNDLGIPPCVYKSTASHDWQPVEPKSNPPRYQQKKYDFSQLKKLM
ncbi:uncharacterized protein LOC110254307 [Exaiptasia diaphana]|uniref:Uncharacterized protein n=1 Tax=Exaiptasia diaphana TaxID=2652724 RepID=A0A913Y9Q0_EXADI|nr:uncharacterized protein LOC110254307 [Exaiptasia diaphana]